MPSAVLCTIRRVPFSTSSLPAVLHAVRRPLRSLLHTVFHVLHTTPSSMPRRPPGRAPSSMPQPSSAHRAPSTPCAITTPCAVLRMLCILQRQSTPSSTPHCLPHRMAWKTPRGVLHICGVLRVHTTRHPPCHAPPTALSRTYWDRWQQGQSPYLGTRETHGKEPATGSPIGMIPWHSPTVLRKPFYIKNTECNHYSGNTATGLWKCFGGFGKCRQVFARLRGKPANGQSHSQGQIKPIGCRKQPSRSLEAAAN